MKKTIKALKTISILSLIALAFVACDKDFSTLESDIQGSQNFGTDSEKFPVIAYNKKLNPVQTNGLTSNLLGVYNDAKYGSTHAHVVSQIALSTYEPDFGNFPEIDSVMITIPYYVTNDETDDDGNTLYVIDSLYGDSKMKLSIYENGYFLRDYNPENIEENQNYFSDANSTINFNNHVGDLLYVSDDFKPSDENSEIILNAGEDDEETLAPSIRVSLENTADFWKTKLLDKEGFPELNNANNFKDYFRGLYFKVEPIDADGSMLMLDFSLANITVYYTNVPSAELGGDREAETFILNFSGTSLNVFENDPSNDLILNADTNANTLDGDETLYLKGGEGGMAVVDLFEGDITVDGVNYDSFDYFKSKKESWLINEAYLEFYVDQDPISGIDISKKQEPTRVLLYDIKNNVPIVDYFFDFTDATTPEDSKIFHSIPLEKNSNEDGKYKIRLTEHINNILLKDSTNLQLGLLVTTNINEITNNSILNTQDEVISGSILSPRGTVLHGSNVNVVEQKRVQLEIFYSETEN